MFSIEIVKIFAYIFIFQLNVLYGVGVRIYSNEFAVHIQQGDEVANAIADKHGFINRGQVGSLKGFYLFEHNHVHKRSLKANDNHHQKLVDEPEVLWVEQQHEKKRTKRDSAFLSDSQYFNNLPHHRRINSRSIPSVDFPDPLYKEQWYLNGGAKNGLDMNVGPAWQKGYTGKGVVVSILDDGIQTNHPDLSQNYDPAASTDINGNDDDPMPQDNGDNKHGTRCAGEVSGVAYNQFCGVGIAYNSSIGGVRMLDGVVNDAVEARALGLNPDHIDIYSASWGPEDDGKTVDGPGPLARRAFIYGVTSGRKGKGSIFVWASGNGGRHTDSCNCDGYTNSIFTLSISSATQGGYKPWYLEECSSTLATTYSSGTPGHDKSVATVDMDARLRPDHICTVEHTGTSASAPLAAGICALALEANPNLTWRDMQYLVVLTSRSSPLEKETGWTVNGVKRKVSHKFGYGLMDAAALVDLAEIWTSVPPQHICKSREIVEERDIGSKYGDSLNLHMDVDACIGTLNEVRFLEHVQCKVSLRFFPRGNLRILLTSPMGTQSTLLFERPRDVVSSNFDDWPFLSVHFWGEQALGRWTLQVINAGSRHVNQPGILKKWQLVFYGSNIQPIRLRQATSSNNRNSWKIPFGNLFSQAPPEPIVKVTDNLFSTDILRNFHNFPNVYTFSGSEKQESITSLGERKTNVRKNIDTTVKDDENVKDCDEHCLQGCLEDGAAKCKPCENSKKTRGCSSPCPSGHFNDSKGACQPCHEACEECSGPNQMNCISCSPDYFRVLDINICLQQCPEGYFADNQQKTCIACHPNCLACENELDHCSSCDHHLLLYQNKCVAACPIGTYETEYYTCAVCHSSCLTCSGPSSSQCISCSNGQFWSEGTCNKECPAYHFADQNHRECTKCPAGCLECNETTCFSCYDNLQIDVKGRCALQQSRRCDRDQYLEGSLCKVCHSTCDSCRGPSEQDCLSCVKPLMLQDTRCVSACFKGTFHDEIERACKPCLHTCTDCFSKINCTECSYGLQLQGSACVSSCVMGFYNDKGHCRRCSTNCETCRGPQQDQCVTCPFGWQLKEGQCKLSCPNEQFKTQLGCKECENLCEDCGGCLPDQEKMNVGQLLLSSHSASTFQIMNSLSFFSTVAIVASFCVIMLLITVFFFLQKSPIMSPQSHVEFRILSMDKPNITCNYKIVGDEDFSDTDNSEGVSLIESKCDRTC